MRNSIQIWLLFVILFYFIHKGSAVTTASYPSCTNPIKDIQATTNQTNFFYIFTGDVKYFSPCNDANINCKATVKWCTDYYTPDACKSYSADYMNKAQFTSISKLAKEISAFSSRKVDGLIINGDLTVSGQSNELYYFRYIWRKYSATDYYSYGKVSAVIDQSYIDNIKEIYMGLGNQDYADNIDICYLNACPISMLDYMLLSFPNGSNYDISNATSIYHLYQGYSYAATQRNGSLAYSWKSCVANYSCFLFFQLHNYPTYTRYINTYNEEYNVKSSLPFLQSQMLANPGLGVVINLHDYDTNFTNADKQLFIQTLTGSFNIYAIFVAHMDGLIGLKEYVCINNRTVPVVYSGSVPANTYLLAKFSAETLNPFINPPMYYKVTVQNLNGNSQMELINNIYYSEC